MKTSQAEKPDIRRFLFQAEGGGVFYFTTVLAHSRCKISSLTDHPNNNFFDWVGKTLGYIIYKGFGLKTRLPNKPLYKIWTTILFFFRSRI